MTTEHRFKEKVAYFEAAMQKYVPAEKELWNDEEQHWKQIYIK